MKSSQIKIKQLGFSILSTFLSIPNMDKLYRESNIEAKYRDPDILDTFVEFYDNQVIEDLVSLSALIRASDDYQPFLNVFYQNIHPSVTIIDLEGCNKQNLREACNKIIHASELKIIQNYTSKNPLYHEDQCYVQDSYFSPQLHLKGKKYKIDWEGVIHVIPFIIYSIQAYEYC